MDLAFKAIQAATQIKAPANQIRRGGHCGLRRLVTSSAIQSTSVASNIQLVVRMLADVVAPYAQGA